ncbi:MAG TPA: UxaA family hydrolase [Anaerovoracaceae bacterium]|nr:UxaA family hydrolase [Anaerovoracaceae bacterium]
MKDTFLGYRRENGTVGVRNSVAVIASVYCVGSLAERISRAVPGTVYFRHPLGCGQYGADLELSTRVLRDIGRNPNFAGVLVVGLGCEKIDPHAMAHAVSESKKRVELIVVQEVGDSVSTVEKGIAIARDMVAETEKMTRSEAYAGELMIGMKCGGSDNTSGLIANPALGMASDRIIAQGGSSIFTELSELFGTEHILARRAADERVAEDIKNVIAKWREKVRRQVETATTAGSVHLISPGNYEGGMSSIIEKSLGGMKKSGTAPLAEVFGYGGRPSRKGLLLMDGSGNDAEACTGEIAAGAQIICFTTGRGTPAGFPGVPIIKITGNPRLYEMMKEDIDFNAGEVVTGIRTLEEVSEEIYREILAVASGKLTKSEQHGYNDLFSVMREY